MNIFKTPERGGAKAAFFTLGCRVNQYETRAMEEQFLSGGFEIVPFSDETNPADVYVINTCTVTAESDRKCRSVVRRACDLAEITNGIVIVVGCYSQKDFARIAEIDGVSLVIGNEGKSRVAQMVEELLKKCKSSHISPIVNVTDIDKVKVYESMKITASDRTRAFVKIVDGCDNKCSYCIIPSVRGHVRSRNEGDIIAEVKGLADAGYKEVVLTGIETAAYGRDFEQKRGDALISLVQKISAIDEISRIRFGSLEPTLFSGDFAERLSKVKSVMPHFHLSLQSGSSEILAAMKRKYNAEMFKRSVDAIRRHFPDATLTTDIIVGFPGETAENFADSVKMLEECEFAYAHIFPYSKREGTPAAKLGGQLTVAEKKRRATELNLKMLEVRKNVLSGFIGKGAKILIETTDGQNAFGHSENFIEYRVPYINGVTEENSFIDVKAVGISEDSMQILGEMID